MATANDIIRRAMRLIHVLDGDEDPTASEAADCLEAINDLIDSWSADGAYLYTVKTDSVTWPASQPSRTIGTSGDFTSTRPLNILDSSYFTDSNSNDYLLKIISTKKGYTSISTKTVESTIPEYLYYEPTHPDGTLYLYPVPSASITVTLYSEQQLTQLSSLTTTISFPPGYKQAFITTLAENIAGEFGVAVPPEVSKAGYKARRRIKTRNRKDMISQVESGLLKNQSAFNIYTDD